MWILKPHYGICVSATATSNFSTESLKLTKLKPFFCVDYCGWDVAAILNGIDSKSFLITGVYFSWLLSASLIKIHLVVDMQFLVTDTE